MLRSHVLNIRWPKTVKNEEVHKRTRIDPWSTKIGKNYTSARKALRVALTQSKTPRGRPRLTWTELMKKQLQAINLTWEEASQQAKERTKWKDILKEWDEGVVESATGLFRLLSFFCLKDFTFIFCLLSSWELWWWTLMMASPLLLCRCSKIKNVMWHSHLIPLTHIYSALMVNIYTPCQPI